MYHSTKQENLRPEKLEDFSKNLDIISIYLIPLFFVVPPGPMN
jgi:hypothetical protein